MKKNFYQILGVYENATLSAVEAAFQTLHAKYKAAAEEGDQTAPENLLVLRSAYETLSNKEKREAYDEQLAAMKFKKAGNESPPQARATARQSLMHSANTSKLVACQVCGKQVSSSASFCPHCGESNKGTGGASALGIASLVLGIGSIFMPYFAAVFLVPAAIICGALTLRSQQRRFGGLGLALGLLGLVGVAYTSNKITNLTTTFQNDVKAQQFPSTKPNALPIVTRSEYEQINEGASYFEVAEIIGDRGEEVSRSDIGDIRTVMYAWRNDDGSNMNAMFQNDRLVNKAQFGLK